MLGACVLTKETYVIYQANGVEEKHKYRNTNQTIQSIEAMFGEPCFATPWNLRRAVGTSLETQSNSSFYIPENDIWRSVLAVFKSDKPILHWLETDTHAWWAFQHHLDLAPYECAMMLKEWFMPTRQLFRYTPPKGLAREIETGWVTTFGGILDKCLRVTKLKGEIDPNDVTIVVHRTPRQKNTRPYWSVNNVRYTDIDPWKICEYGCMAQAGHYIDISTLRKSKGETE